MTRLSSHPAVRRFCWQFDVFAPKKRNSGFHPRWRRQKRSPCWWELPPLKSMFPLKSIFPLKPNVNTPAVRGRDCVVASSHGSLATVLHDCRGQKALFHIVHTHTVHARAFHSLEPLLNRLEPRFVTTSSRFQVLHPLFDVVEALFDAH